MSLESRVHSKGTSSRIHTSNILNIADVFHSQLISIIPVLVVEMLTKQCNRTLRTVLIHFPEDGNRARDPRNENSTEKLRLHSMETINKNLNQMKGGGGINDERHIQIIDKVDQVLATDWSVVSTTTLFKHSIHTKMNQNPMNP